ncbi:phytoene/squalene synthase family protein [Tumebacillus flagellatus]|nr:phytoene/squalene synthase family protein [Tumebacillus flagellatus]
MNLMEAYSHCEIITQTYSSSFYQAFSYLPKKQRRAIWAVYAFCREIDNLVDEEGTPEAEKQLRVEAFLRKMEGAQRGEWPREAMWTALCDVFDTYEMEWQPFYEMLEGQASDLRFQQPQTLEEAERYCYLVAGTVGLMILPILAPHATQALREDAVKLGIAMQWTNILRDVREDLGRERLYLPRDLMEKFGVTAEDLMRGAVTPQWRQLAALLTERAERCYREGMQSVASYPLASRLPLLAAGEIYREILREIVRRDYDVFGVRAFVPPLRKKELLHRLFLRAPHLAATSQEAALS